MFKIKCFKSTMLNIINIQKNSVEQTLKYILNKWFVKFKIPHLFVSSWRARLREEKQKLENHSNISHGKKKNINIKFTHLSPTHILKNPMRRSAPFSMNSWGLSFLSCCLSAWNTKKLQNWKQKKIISFYLNNNKKI